MPHPAAADVDRIPLWLAGLREERHKMQRVRIDRSSGDSIRFGAGLDIDANTEGDAPWKGASPRKDSPWHPSPQTYSFGTQLAIEVELLPFGPDVPVHHEALLLQV
jgi:hypothetical protein